MTGRGVADSQHTSDRRWLAEDWCSALVGLTAVIAAILAFRGGSSLRWLAVTPRVWTDWPEVFAQCRDDLPRYLALGGILLAFLTPATWLMGQRPVRFAVGFVTLYLMSIVILLLTAWNDGRQAYLETPLVALLAGLFLANVMTLPGWLESGLRAEFYIKIAVVLLGATLPLPVIMLAGPIAILQASIVSVVTFLVIYNVARFLNLDRRLAAMLAGGGSICGISAIIAIAGAVRAKREDIPVATTMVVGWALAMIVLLPLLARAWYLPAGVGGAWIGTSEYADAAGFAAAQTFGAFARDGSIAGTPDQALWSYTLVKIVGRDMWIGIWAAALSLISVMRWEPREDGRRVDLTQIWRRFPKFIIGFVVASLMVTWASGGGFFQGPSFADFEAVTRPLLMGPIETLRNWALTFSFLSIGASLRIRRLAPITGDAFIAFSAGVVVNLVLGFVLSAIVFQSYWTSIAR